MLDELERNTQGVLWGHASAPESGRGSDAAMEAMMSDKLNAQLREILDRRDQAKGRVDADRQEQATIKARQAAIRASNCQMVAQAVPQTLTPIIQEVREDLASRGFQIRPVPLGGVAAGEWTYEYEVFSTAGEQLPQAKLRFSFTEPQDVRAECTGGLQIRFGGRTHQFVKIALSDFTREKALELVGSYLLKMLEPPPRAT
jgi:hypothetical protein